MPDRMKLTELDYDLLNRCAAGENITSSDRERDRARTRLKRLGCPFCGVEPWFGKKQPQRDAMIRCENDDCPAHPEVCLVTNARTIEGWNTRATSPARDAAEGGRKMVSEIPFDPTNHHNALKCPYCNPEGLTFAPPKPAPDAVPSWEDVAEDDPDVVLAAHAIAKHGIGRPWDDFLPVNAFDVDHGDLTEYARAAVAALRAKASAPVPPADGALDLPPTKSRSTPSEVVGANHAGPEREEEIRPHLSSATGAADPVAWGRPHVEYSASRKQSRVEFWVSREDGQRIAAGLALPPVRGDREMLAETIHKARYRPDRTPQPFADEDKNGREYCFRIADALIVAGLADEYSMRALRQPPQSSGDGEGR